ncbi:hypothetical protein BpHYR1_035961 [Brachionus plicatilis]|uniref:Uncharacterized protein n=1 Tax=Brachionus plicatilis TaxID=10195 RepID=A0A3M7RUW7_BRAPC|nr:hypothetical protein BpHYR1_035961 [Brachionus plicatilis]
MLFDLTNTPTSQTDSTPVSTLKRRKKIEPRSWVWQSQNFVKINESSAKCNICQQMITIYNSSTTEFSFNIVNSEEFQELLDTIKSHYYKLPCSQTLRYKLLPEMFLILPEVENGWVRVRGWGTWCITKSIVHLLCRIVLITDPQIAELMHAKFFPNSHCSLQPLGEVAQNKPVKSAHSLKLPKEVIRIAAKAVIASIIPIKASKKDQIHRNRRYCSMMTKFLVFLKNQKIFSRTVPNNSDFISLVYVYNQKFGVNKSFQISKELYVSFTKLLNFGYYGEECINLANLKNNFEIVK